MQKVQSEERETHGFARCVVCGIRLYSASIPRCEWCEDQRIHEVLHSLLQHISEYLGSSEPSTPRADPPMAFVADIGALASKHPYLSWLRKALTLLLERGVVKRTASAERIWGTNLLVRTKRVLPLLTRINLCGLNVDSDGRMEIEWPTGSILKRANSWLQTEPSRNDTAAFLLGYILLNAIDETIESLDSGQPLTFDVGVSRLYPIEYDENGQPEGLRMPKGITSVISFVIGSWARGWTEFDEFTLHKFLEGRGVTGKEYDEAIGMLSQTVPGMSHSMMEYEIYSYGGVPVKRFRYSQAVLNLRNYLRQRLEERTR